MVVYCGRRGCRPVFWRLYDACIRPAVCVDIARAGQRQPRCPRPAKGCAVRGSSAGTRHGPANPTQQSHDTGEGGARAPVYFDKRLSSDGTVLAPTCHDPQKGWTTRSRFSTGVHGGKGPSPTSPHATYMKVQFWTVAQRAWGTGVGDRIANRRDGKHAREVVASLIASGLQTAVRASVPRAHPKNASRSQSRPSSGQCSRKLRVRQVMSRATRARGEPEVPAWQGHLPGQGPLWTCHVPPTFSRQRLPQSRRWHQDRSG